MKNPFQVIRDSALAKRLKDNTRVLYVLCMTLIVFFTFWYIYPNEENQQEDSVAVKYLESLTGVESRQIYDTLHQRRKKVS